LVEFFFSQDFVYRPPSSSSAWHPAALLMVTGVPGVKRTTPDTPNSLASLSSSLPRSSGCHSGWAFRDVALLRRRCWPRWCHRLSISRLPAMISALILLGRTLERNGKGPAGQPFETDRSAPLKTWRGKRDGRWPRLEDLTRLSSGIDHGGLRVKRFAGGREPVTSGSPSV